jgi:hypothetical protein
MFDPLAAVAVAALAFTVVVSLVLGRIIPDHYDHLRLSRVPIRKR